MLDFGLALGLVGSSMTGTGRAGVVCAVVIVVYARVPSELVGAGKALLASGERAFKRFFARVRADVAGLDRNGER